MSDSESSKRWTEKSAYLAAVSDESAGQVKQVAPSAVRNRDPIIGVLKQVLPDSGKVLEIASGTGQHIVSFAEAWPGIEWTPSDPDPQARASISAWIEDSGTPNVRQPENIDVTKPDWYEGIADTLTGIICINLLHISPWQACEGLMAGAQKLLGQDAFLYFYGPFTRDGRHTAPSNEEFDRSLKHRNPHWGVRDVGDVAACAGAHGLLLDRVVEMPANNLSIVLRMSS